MEDSITTSTNCTASPSSSKPPDPEACVGRCDDIVAQGVILRDADVHREGDPAAGKSRAEFLDQARRFGAWPNLKRILVPAESVREIRRLGEI